MAAVPSVEVEVIPELIDGFLWDPETGECLGPAVEPGFVVDTPEKAEWVLRKLADAEAGLVAVEAMRAAALKNLDEMVARARKRVDSVHYRFGAELEHFARGAIAGTKARFWQCAFGKIAFRAVRSAVRVVDQARAVAFARVACPDAVVTQEKFLISRMPAEMKEAILDGSLWSGGAWQLPDPEAPAVGGRVMADWGFEVLPEREDVTITTGVTQAANADAGATSSAVGD